MKKIIICMFFSIALTMFVNSQPVTEWTREYSRGTGYYEGFNDFETDGSGNIYCTGTSDSNSSATGYAIIVKYAPDGTRLWTRTYDWSGIGGNGLYINYDIKGYVYVTCRSQDTPGGIKSVWVLKYGVDGTFYWARRLLFSGVTPYSTIIGDKPIFKSNYLFVAGDMTEPGGTGSQVVVFRLTPTGSYISGWYGSIGVIEGTTAITIDAANSVYVTGRSGLNALAVKFTIALSTVWAKTFSDTTRSQLYTYDGNVISGNKLYITGQAWSGTFANCRFVAMQLNTSDGSLNWYRRLDVTGARGIETKAITDNSGNLICGGFHGTSTAPGVKSIVIKYNSSGVLQWTKEPEGLSHVHSMTSDASNNIYVSGKSAYGKYFAKLTSSGVVSWYGAWDWDKHGYRIKYLNSGHLVICGSNFNSGVNLNMILAKYSIAGSLSKPVIEPVEAPAEFSLTQNYPNPFNPATTIKFALPVNGMTTLKVYDIAGKEVASLVEADLEAGNHEVNFNASQLSSGTYFYRITSGSFTDIKKMMLVK
ncbi:MAG: T9SS type A sorting domain-containing protein [Ignavibacteria bacterium]|nr:T9SS type A sorting domain-containing protein [Ignavibacteria bacterium]